MGKIRDILIDSIAMSPYQPRRQFSQIEELAENISEVGLINAITVRTKEGGYELLTGERRLRAVKLLDWERIKAKVEDVSDYTARKMILSENIQRDDLTAIEEIDALAKWIDFLMLEAGGYAEEYQKVNSQIEFQHGSCSEKELLPLNRLSWLLMKLNNAERRGDNDLSNKFIRQVEEAFESLPKKVEWQSFYINDLKPYLKFDEDVKEVSIEKKLNKSQAKALNKVKKKSSKVFDEVKETGKGLVDATTDEEVPLEEMSSREIADIPAQEEWRGKWDKRATVPKEKEVIVPESEYRCIVVDPPWPVKKIQREVRPNQGEQLDYPTMTIESIKNIDIQSLVYKNGCHLYLWTTHKFLPDAIEIMKIWGFNYQCILTWVKNVGFTPFSWMYSTELVLFGRCGNLSLLKKGLRIDFEGKVREHSRKPDEFYEIVKKASSEPRLDMFSREKRDGFDQWGCENEYF